MTRTAPTTWDMLRAGGRLVRRHPGIVAVVYAVQLAVSALAGIVAASAIAGATALWPATDAALAGDVALLAHLIDDNQGAVGALLWTLLAVALGWAMVSWFLTGGFLALAVSDGGDVRAFGAGGAATFGRFARVALWSIAPYGAALLALAIGAGAAVARAGDAMTTGALVGAALPPLVPGLVLLAIARAAADYARASLAVDGSLAAWRAMLRGFRLTFTRRRVAGHFALYYTVVIGVAAVYLAATWGRPMAGAAGFAALLALRQAMSVVHYLAKVALLAGQATLVATATDPPARRG